MDGIHPGKGRPLELGLGAVGIALQETCFSFLFVSWGNQRGKPPFWRSDSQKMTPTCGKLQLSALPVSVKSLSASPFESNKVYFGITGFAHHDFRGSESD